MGEGDGCGKGVAQGDVGDGEGIVVAASDAFGWGALVEGEFLPLAIEQGVLGNGYVEGDVGVGVVFGV